MNRQAMKEAALDIGLVVLVGGILGGFVVVLPELVEYIRGILTF